MEKQDYEIARDEIRTLWNDHVKAKGLQIEVSGPFPESKDEWPCLKYVIIVNGESVEWRMGTGFAGMNKFNGRENSHIASLGFNEQEWGCLHLMLQGKRLSDKQLEARIACACAKKNKVFPDISEVVGSLARQTMDARNAGDFETFCGEFGYDTDSSNAKGIYDACLEHMGKLRRMGFVNDQISKLAELSAQL